MKNFKRDAIVQNKVSNSIESNTNNIIEEIKELSTSMQGALAQEYGFSDFIGNDGKYCTLTKECMPMCN